MSDNNDTLLSVSWNQDVDLIIRTPWTSEQLAEKVSSENDIVVFLNNWRRNLMSDEPKKAPLGVDPKKAPLGVDPFFKSRWVDKGQKPTEWVPPRDGHDDLTLPIDAEKPKTAPVEKVEDHWRSI